MKKAVTILLLSLAVIFIFSCGKKGKSNMLPEIATADSAAVMFYNKITDPRFFKYTKVYKVNEMEQLIKDVNAKVVKEMPGCPTEGKIYFYKKKGMIDVVYFSGREGCRRFYFIINGEKYYVKMSNTANDYLDSLQPLAKEPVSTY
jgi:hypothetical protein